MNRGVAQLVGVGVGATAGYFIGRQFGTWKGAGPRWERILIGGPAAWGTGLGSLTGLGVASLIVPPAPATTSTSTGTAGLNPQLSPQRC